MSEAVQARWPGISRTPRTPLKARVAKMIIKPAAQRVPVRLTFPDGTVWGAGAMSMTSADGGRQMSVGVNLMRWNTLDSSGKPQHHPIDDALPALYQLAMCGNGVTMPAER